MTTRFSRSALAVDTELYDAPGEEYEHLWKVIRAVEADPEEAKHAPWSQYVSTHKVWGAKVPGTDLTVFWRTDDDGVVITSIFRDLGI